MTLPVPVLQVPVPGFGTVLDERELAWRSTRHAGIQWLPLHLAAPPPDDPRAPVEGVVLIRMAPGRGYPPHRHVDAEDVLVLRGGYRDDLGEYRSGAYVRYAAGSEHAPVALGDASRPEGADNPACVLFAIARGGIVALTDEVP